MANDTVSLDANDDVVAVDNDIEVVNANIDDAEVIAVENEDAPVSAEAVESENVLKDSGKGFNFGNGTGFNLGNMTFNINGTTFNIGDLTNGTFSLGNGTSFNISSLMNGTFSFGNGSTFNISSILNGTGNGTTFDMSSFMKIFGGDTASDTIEAEDLTVNYAPTITYKVTVKNGNKTATQGNVVFTINNNEYIGHIGSDGVASVDLSDLKPGKYFIIAEYGQAMVKKTITVKDTGSQTAAKKKTKTKLTAKNKTFKAKVKIKKYTVILKTNVGKALKNVKLTLKIKNKTYKATANSKGKATFKITKLTKKGKYSSKVKFAGNSNYNSASKTVKITVKK